MNMSVKSNLVINSKFFLFQIMFDIAQEKIAANQVSYCSSQPVFTKEWFFFWFNWFNKLFTDVCLQADYTLSVTLSVLWNLTGMSTEWPAKLVRNRPSNFTKTLKCVDR